MSKLPPESAFPKKPEPKLGKHTGFFSSAFEDFVPSIESVDWERMVPEMCYDTLFGVDARKQIRFLQALPYKEYLKSAHWNRTKGRALMRYRDMCVLCNATDRMHVHHKNYDHLGYEYMDDLVVLCHKCHAIVHGILPEEPQ